MSVIKQISIFNGSNWDTPADIGANAENIDFTYTTGSQQGSTAALSSILPAQVLTASRVLTTDSNGKLSSSSISSGVLNTALSGASTTTSLQSQINTLNTNLDKVKFIRKTFTYSYTNLAANGSLAITGNQFGISYPSGYTPIAIVTARPAGSSNQVSLQSIVSLALTGIVMVIKNLHTAAISDTATITILYCNSSLISDG